MLDDNTIERLRHPVALHNFIIDCGLVESEVIRDAGLCHSYLNAHATANRGRLILEKRVRQIVAVVLEQYRGHLPEICNENRNLRAVEDWDTYAKTLTRRQLKRELRDPKKMRLHVKSKRVRIGDVVRHIGRSAPYFNRLSYASKEIPKEEVDQVLDFLDILSLNGIEFQTDETGVFYTRKYDCVHYDKCLGLYAYSDGDGGMCIGCKKYAKCTLTETIISSYA